MNEQSKDVNAASEEAKTFARSATSEPQDRTDADERINELIKLVAHVRHEINNPLTGIIGQAQLLLRDKTLNEAAQRRVRIIEDLAKRIRDTVAELRVVQNKTDSPDPSTSGKDSTQEPPRH